MRIDVRSEVVRSNLELLKHLIRSASALQKDADFEAFVEKSTGGLILASKDIPADGRWKAIRIRWFASSSPEKGIMEIDEPTQADKTSFIYTDLTREAREALADTFHTVNHIFSRELRNKTIEEALNILEATSISSPGCYILHAAFHDIDRQNAEKLLAHSPLGTFLFRDEPYARILEEELSLRFDEPIRCITLTVVGEDRKVFDYTIVDRLGKFQIYNDDTHLEKPAFSSIDDLLANMGTLCRTPLKKRFR